MKLAQKNPGVTIDTRGKWVVEKGSQQINIASPKLKNRYRSFTASS